MSLILVTLPTNPTNLSTWRPTFLLCNIWLADAVIHYTRSFPIKQFKTILQQKYIATCQDKFKIEPNSIFSRHSYLQFNTAFRCRLHNVTPPQPIVLQFYLMKLFRGIHTIWSAWFGLIKAVSLEILGFICSLWIQIKLQWKFKLKMHHQKFLGKN